MEKFPDAKEFRKLCMQKKGAAERSAFARQTLELISDASQDGIRQRARAWQPRDSYLHFLAAWGDEETMALALSKCSSPDVPDADCGCSPLQEALSSGNAAAARLLAAAGADLKWTDRDGQGILHYAAYSDDMECLRLAHSWAPGQINQASAGDEEMLERLGQAPEIPEREDWPRYGRRRWDEDDEGPAPPPREELYTNEGLTPLMCAIDASGIECALALIDWGADPKTEDPDGMHALARSAKYCSAEFVKALAQRFESPDWPCSGGESALAMAIAQGNARSAQALLEAGADPDYEWKAKFSRAQTARGQAKKIKSRENLEKMEALLEAWDLRKQLKGSAAPAQPKKGKSI